MLLLFFPLSLRNDGEPGSMYPFNTFPYLLIRLGSLVLTYQKDWFKGWNHIAGGYHNN